MICCAYDNETKFTWDSRGNRNPYVLDNDRPNWEELTETNAGIPVWASAQFDTELDAYRRQVGLTKQAVDGVDMATAERFNELGYLLG